MQFYAHHGCYDLEQKVGTYFTVSLRLKYDATEAIKTDDVTKAVNEIKSGKIEYRLDKTNIIHCPIGKVSFGPDKLKENLDTLMDAIVKAKPAATKGQYIKSVTVASTMGPGVKINANKFTAAPVAE